MNKKILLLGQAALMFQVETRWLRREARAGRVPCLKAGRTLLFDPEAVEAALIKRASTEQTDKEAARDPKGGT